MVLGDTRHNPLDDNVTIAWYVDWESVSGMEYHPKTEPMDLKPICYLHSMVINLLVTNHMFIVMDDDTVNF